MERIYVCKECDKPKPGKVDGKARSGRKLIKALQAADLGVEIVPCKCLGKCKKGPNAMALPQCLRLHRVTVKKMKKLLVTTAHSDSE